MNEEYENPNEGQENVVDSQNEEAYIDENEAYVDESEENQEVANPEQQEETQQTKDENAKYAAMRRKIEEEASLKYQQELNTYRSKLDTLKNESGYDVDELLNHYKQQKEQMEIEDYAYNNSVSEQEARESLQTKNKMNELEQRLQNYEARESLKVQELELQKKPYWNEVKDEVNSAIANAIGPVPNMEMVYQYILGRKMSSGELIKNERKNATQNAIADMQFRAKGGGDMSTSYLPSGNDIDPKSVLDESSMRMAEAFGVDLKEAALHAKKYINKKR